MRKSIGGISYPTTEPERADIRSLAEQGIIGPVSAKVHPNVAYGYAFGYPIERLIDDIAHRVLALLPPGQGGTMPTVEEIADAVIDEQANRLLD
jgi:hypothetical protein